MSLPQKTNRVGISAETIEEINKQHGYKSRQVLDMNDKSITIIFPFNNKLKIDEPHFLQKAHLLTLAENLSM